MTILDLKNLIKKYSDSAIIQINIADGYNVIGYENINVDDEYEKDDALVFVINTDE